MNTSLLPAFAVFFALCAAGLFKYNKTYAVAFAFMLGWLFLPSYVYELAQMPKSNVFPLWVLGSSVPSLDWFSKAWFIPVSIVFLAFVLDRSRLFSFRPFWLDGLIITWCLWPMFQSWIVGRSEPNGVLQSAYLFGTWAMPWFIGRLYFSNAADQLRLVKTISLTCLFYLPVSLIEGVFEPILHEYVYGANAFRHVGIDRYIGFRPIGFLEDGNQFAAVIAITSIAAVWLSRLAVGPRAWFYKAQAAVLCCMAIATQSAGAIILGAFGIGLIYFWQVINARFFAFLAAIILLMFGLTYALSSDFSHWLWSSSIGQFIVGSLKSIGKGSLVWRVWADQAALSTVRDSIFLGTGDWAWWRKANIRPWGLPQLLIGQFGLLAVAIAMFCLSIGAFCTVVNSERALAGQPKGGGLILSVMLFLALADGLLNSFIYFPVFLIAGSLANKASHLIRFNRQ
jgi:hypothetical protein